MFYVKEIQPLLEEDVKTGKENDLYTVHRKEGDKKVEYLLNLEEEPEVYKVESERKSFFDHIEGLDEYFGITSFETFEDDELVERFYRTFEEASDQTDDLEKDLKEHGYSF